VTEFTKEQKQRYHELMELKKEKLAKRFVMPITQSVTLYHDKYGEIQPISRFFEASQKYVKLLNC
jgi:vacuolar-type H+-ATPase subunit D/Vma8